MDLYTRSLFDHINRNGFFGMEETRCMIYKLLQATEYLHQKGIIHRDIKLENIMLQEDGAELNPILIDFGLAEYQSHSSFFYTRCGTPGFVAPEILELTSDSKETYGPACDIFSLGVLLYVL